MCFGYIKTVVSWSYVIGIYKIISSLMDHFNRLLIAIIKPITNVECTKLK